MPGHICTYMYVGIAISLGTCQLVFLLHNTIPLGACMEAKPIEQGVTIPSQTPKLAEYRKNPSSQQSQVARDICQ